MTSANWLKSSSLCSLHTYSLKVSWYILPLAPCYSRHDQDLLFRDDKMMSRLTRALFALKIGSFRDLMLGPQVVSGLGHVWYFCFLITKKIIITPLTISYQYLPTTYWSQKNNKMFWFVIFTNMKLSETCEMKSILFFFSLSEKNDYILDLVHA